MKLLNVKRTAITSVLMVSFIGFNANAQILVNLYSGTPTTFPANASGNLLSPISPFTIAAGTTVNYSYNANYASGTNTPLGISIYGFTNSNATGSITGNASKVPTATPTAFSGSFNTSGVTQSFLLYFAGVTLGGAITYYSLSDLLIWIGSLPTPGPSPTDTQQSLVNTASALQNIYTLQNSVLANSFSYDCDTFGANNICVSAGGRNTAVSAANGLNNTSALLIAAYRPHPNYRIGAYADQNLSVNNAGSTVNLGNNTPLIGLFGVWNERLDGRGTEVKVSAAYGQKNTTITRSVVGTSEAGSGSSQLNSQGAQVTAKYGFTVADNTIVSP